MMTRLFVMLLILMGTALGQEERGVARYPGTHYPSVIRAEMPLYPLVARATHVSGTVEVQVTVEKGVVVEAEVKSVDIHVFDPTRRAVYGEAARSAVAPSLSNPTLDNIKTWRFQPDDAPATFIVRYVYTLLNEEKPLAYNENPQIELDLPRLVKIIARPFKPQCDDCPPEK